MFEAIPDSRPWLVLVWISCESGNHSHSLVKTCEGALIRDNWVLTVARCFQDCHDGLEFISATVDIGLHNNDVRREIVSGRNNTKRIPVEKIYLNNNNFVISSVENEMQKQLIQNMSVSNDLALLRLSVSVRDQNRVISLPNCTTEDLPSNSQSIDDFLIPESTSTASQMHSDEEALKGQGRNNREVVDESKRDSNCLINSWGGIASSATVLQEMDLRLLSRDECVQFSGGERSIYVRAENLMCALLTYNSVQTYRIIYSYTCIFMTKKYIFFRYFIDSLVPHCKLAHTRTHTHTHRSQSLPKFSVCRSVSQQHCVCD